MAVKANRRGFITILAAPPLMAILMALVWSTDFVTELENVTVDRRFRARADTDPPADSRIAMIGVGDHSLKMAGRWEDWSREIHGAFAAALGVRPPKVLAFDLFFSEPSADPSHDESFAFNLETLPGAITGTRIDVTTADVEEDRSEPPNLHSTPPLTQIIGDRHKILRGTRANAPIEPLAISAWTGIVNCPASRSDGRRRKIPLIGMIRESIYPSLVLQILIQLEDANADQVIVTLGDTIEVPKKDGGSWFIPIDEGGYMEINYRNTERLEIFDYIATLGQLGAYDQTNEWPEAFPPLVDQIVFVGQSAEGLQDLGPTPYASRDPLFRVQATALDNILQSDHIASPSKHWVIAVWLFVAWLTLILLYKAPVALEIIIPLLTVVGYVYASYYLFEGSSFLLPIVLPVASFVLIHSTAIGDRLVLELQEKRYIKGVFGSYVSPEVVAQIIDSGEFPKLGGEKVDISILFSDIQGFSTFSEQLEPEELVHLMVEYLSAMTDIITDDGGTLDKYIGDAIDAMYGAPLPVEGHAYRAVTSTIRMQEKQAELCEQWKEEGRRELIQNMRTRIGLNTGPAVVGNMGSVTRFNYTMMGDNVNLGARCESGAKAYGVYTMVTDATRKAATETNDDIVYRYLDQIVVQGRTLPVKVHEVLGKKDGVSKKTMECLELYSLGFDSYQQAKWDEAIHIFENASKLEPFQPARDYGIKTNPSLMMIERCGTYKVSPPPADWDGVYRMTSK